MKDAKTFPLLFVSLLLILIASLVLLSTWGYYKFYYKNEVEQPKTKVVAKNTNANNEDYRDSLQELYVSTFNNLNTSFNTRQNSDSLHFNPTADPDGFNKLRNEIEAILKNHPLKADLDIARQKILELQNKLTELNNKNISTEDENKRLNGKLDQLTKEIKGVEQNIKTDRTEKNSITKNTSAGSAFTVSQLHVAAIKESAEEETTEADNTEKLVGSFIIKSLSDQFNSVEIIVVALRPDGRVMQGSSWESGTFDTNQGRKIYSAKLNFDYSAGGSKRLTFSLSSNQFQKGEYTIVIYHNGIIIGKALKTLT